MSTSHFPASNPSLFLAIIITLDIEIVSREMLEAKSWLKN